MELNTEVLLPETLITITLIHCKGKTTIPVPIPAITRYDVMGALKRHHEKMHKEEGTPVCDMKFEIKQQ